MMSPNKEELIVKIINDMALKLGITQEKLYLALKRQALIDGIIGLIWTLIGIGIVFFYLYNIVRAVNKNKDRALSKIEIFDVLFNNSFINIVGAVIGFIIILFNIYNKIPGLLNPDYYIIQYILSQL